MKSTKKYQVLTQREAILNAPEMYAGSVLQEKRREYHFDGKRVTYADTTVPFAVIHCFKETVGNAADNKYNSIKEGHAWQPGIVTTSGNTYTVRSFGSPIEIERDPDNEDRYFPDIIFSTLNSGSSFVDEENRTTGGRHGLGGKICNIFSTDFTVKVGNALQKRYYERTWYDNCTACSDEVVDFEYTGQSFVEVSVTLDMTRFGYPAGTPFSDSCIDIFRWVVASTSFAMDYPMFFNGVKLDYSDAKSYATLYTLDGKLGKHIIHVEPNKKLIAFDAPGRGRQISFANSVITHKGGKHLNNAIDDLTKGLLDKKTASTTTATTEKPKRTVKKAGDATLPPPAPKKPATLIPKRDLKTHMIVIVAVAGISARYDNGQTKTSLIYPTNVHFNIPQETKDKLRKWALVKALEDQFKIKALDKEIQEERKKDEALGKVKGEDANWSKVSDWKRRSQVVYSLLEGTSAAEYEKRLLDCMVRGRDRYGCIELRGKPKNAMKGKEETVLRNKEIKHIIKRIGLTMHMDYLEQKNLETLRCGRIRVMADPDPDGFHIAGLVIAFFHHFFPSLLKRNDFVYIWFRPKIQVTLGKETRRFYTTKDYDEWTAITPNFDRWNHRYFKGLGGCTPEDVRLDYDNPREILALYDALAAEKIALSFGQHSARGDWISEWSADDQGILPADQLAISNFIDWYIREYSHETLLRNLPGIDTMTRVKRKTVHATFEVFGRRCVKTKQCKISPNFAGDIGKITHYHQGDSIPGAVIGMAQDFVGSNNIPYFKGFGAFGNVDGGGNDASQPRYLEVLPSKLLPLIFCPEDDVALDYIIDEGEAIEPRHFVPIIPLVLCNGANAVGMGFSSTIPAYHPLEVIDSYLDRVELGAPFAELVPWSRGHHGRAEIEGDTFISYGVIENVTATSCVVTQLPIGMWNRKYAKKIAAMISDGNVKSVETHCTATQTRFTLHGISFLDADKKPRAYTYEDLHLVNYTKLNNIKIFDKNEKIVSFPNIAAYMEYYYEFRMPYYVKRQDNLLSSSHKTIECLKQKIAYVDAVCEGKIVITPPVGEELDEESVIKSIEAAGLWSAFYKKDKGSGVTVVTPSDLSTQGRKRTAAALARAEEELAELKKITPESMWITDLQKLRAGYISVYGDDSRVVTI